MWYAYDNLFKVPAAFAKITPGAGQKRRGQSVLYAQNARRGRQSLAASLRPVRAVLLRQAQRRGSVAQVFFLCAGLRLLKQAHRLLTGAKEREIQFFVVWRNDPPSGPLAGPDWG